MLLLVIAQLQCAPRIDTLQDTIYAVLTPARPTPSLTPAVLTPIVRDMAKQANSHGWQIMSLGNGPDGPILDLRTGATPQPLPAMFTRLPEPRSMTEDTLALRMVFRVGPDSTRASAPYILRRIYVLPIKQQAQPLPANPRPAYAHGGPTRPDTALVQFAVTPDGLVDTSTYYPVRARSQASIDAIRAVLPALHFRPAVALNDCPARTVLSQRMIVTPP
jgi:hypothetical protein